MVGTQGRGDLAWGDLKPPDAGGRIGMVPQHGHLPPAKTGGQREEGRPRRSPHVWSLWPHCLPADAETLEEPLLSLPSELSVLDRLGLHR